MAKDLLENIGDTCNRMFKRGKVRISEAEYTFNKCALLTISFWLCQSTLQTASGFVGLSIGKPFPIVVGVGLLSTIISNTIVNNIPVPNISDGISGKFDKNDKFEVARRVIIGVGVFTILERKAFKTVLPSSLLTVGVYGMNRASVLATSEVATATQRLKMQKLGRLFGCHHCGSRQLVNRNTFIADHMPPTKMVKEINAKWWRKALGLTMSQRLFPQCQKCFSLQGAAVRAGVHFPIFHYMPRYFHLAPAIAYLLSKDSSFNSISADLIDPIVYAFIKL